MKTAGDSTNRLTVSNLEQHGEFLQRQESNTKTVPWAEKVIKDEQIHQFYSQSHQRTLERRHPQDAIRDIHLAATSISRTDPSIGSLKLFEPQQGMCLEEPLERFLTPDGCGGPDARAALREMGYSFGSMDGREERKQIAQQRAETVVKMKARERAVDSRRS
ncbi:uncharacterized protein EURHEDRAFT_374335 [Aspergillus ruber CBS 135680]|uniref:Uncharacterized protein n=1 Tax=Aspergillus ruber (strain CBS 135680) TaxID=1388766 RepID=A0A017SRQ8_ASPRC|nr:uncharacterized protein EURHEDRAFT_374335 [Aspergillus ruber CBS 135680]EYE99274.1 hypothetical protein EURHEDRAFT_374335 [Aspergillus ruber CBS 135680]